MTLIWTQPDAPTTAFLGARWQVRLGTTTLPAGGRLRLLRLPSGAWAACCVPYLAASIETTITFQLDPLP